MLKNKDVRKSIGSKNIEKLLDTVQQKWQKFPNPDNEPAIFGKKIGNNQMFTHCISEYVALKRELFKAERIKYRTSRGQWNTECKASGIEGAGEGLFTLQAITNSMLDTNKVPQLIYECDAAVMRLGEYQKYCKNTESNSNHHTLFNLSYALQRTKLKNSEIQIRKHYLMVTLPQLTLGRLTRYTPMRYKSSWNL